MLKEMVETRKLPPLKSREEMLDILLREEYGFLPFEKAEFSIGGADEGDNRYGGIEARLCGGDVNIDAVPFTITTEHGSHTFPLYRMLNNDGKKRPFFISIGFHAFHEGFYMPAEMLADGGFNVLHFNYKDVTSDDGDFSNGIAPLLLPEGQKKGNDAGKIAMWSFAARRIMDYAETLPQLDLDNAAVCGHSRLGKTALLTGALDTRIKFVFSNDSGCSGAALSRGNSGLKTETLRGHNLGETIRAIYDHFPFWFCKNYQKHTQLNYGFNFDQHYLLASIAPRYAYVASASLDTWADPVSEQLCCVAASEAWEKENLTGFIHNDKLLEPGECLHEGNIGYHLRYGKHFFSIHDWQRYMEYINKHK